MPETVQERLRDLEDEVRKLAMSLPPSDFGSTRAIQAIAKWASSLIRERDEARARAAPVISKDRIAEDTLKAAERALKPFADRVYNDNGDHTISDMYKLTGDDCSRAYFALRKIRALLSNGEA